MDPAYSPHSGLLALPPANRNRQILDIYNVYRLLLSLILLISFIFAMPDSLLGAFSRELFMQAVSGYALMNFLLAFIGLLPLRQALATRRGIIAIILVDILLLVLISYSCGGVSSGMAHLLLVPIATGSILQPGRLSIFFAAVGTIAVIYSEVHLYLSLQAESDFYVQAGLLGLTLFATSLAIQVLGGRLRHNELLSAEQASRIQSLRAMNHQIIQRMHTGIIVTAADGELLNINHAALRLLSRGEQGRSLSLPPPLRRQLEAWRANPRQRPEPFHPAPGMPLVQASFAWLNPGEDAHILIFLEDYSLMASRMQQLKLVSLGRLTASIAHEVRNPLGAISHAGQLLAEVESLDAEDRHLVDIINHHCGRVNSIIENILQLSRHNQAVPQLLNLGDWLGQFLGKYQSSLGQPSEIDVELLTPDMQVRFNPVQLEQLLTNLCDNGLRYSLRDSGRARLTLRAADDARRDLRWLDVIDEGQGIPREDEEKVFEPFFTTETEGTGLGLYICREICEANQSQLLYRRTGAGKSCFRILFPHQDRHMV